MSSRPIKKKIQDRPKWRFEGYGLYLRAPYFGIGKFGSSPVSHESSPTEDRKAHRALAIKWAFLVGVLFEVARFLLTGHLR